MFLTDQIGYIFGIGLNKFPARLYLISHQHGKDTIGFTASRILPASCPIFRIHRRIPQLYGIHFTETFVTLYGNSVPADFIRLLFNSSSLYMYHLLRPFHNWYQGRLCNIDMSARNQRFQIAIEKCQQQRSDICAPSAIGIRHDNNLIVTEFFYIKLIADPRPKSGDHRANFFIARILSSRVFFPHSKFYPQRQDRLETTIPSDFAGAARAVCFDQINLRQFRVAFGTISKLQAGSTLPMHFCVSSTPRFAGGFPGTAGQMDFQ